MRRVFLLVIVSYMVVSQICWARCICDPSDRLCLDSCVNNARDCIEACRDTLCFTDCINIHWPGTTFEEQVNLEIDASYQEDISITIDSSSDNKESSTKETTSNTSFLTVPLPSLLDAPSISFTTVHTTITSLITMTPAPSSSNNNAANTISFGLRSTDINSISLCIILLSTTCILI